MKTMTEFSSFALKNAVQTADQLATSGKTPEEMPAALGEALKLEGDKLNWLVAAIDVVRTRKPNLKRILVMTLAEGESAPQGAEVKEGFVLVTEFFPAAGSAQRRESHGDRDERGGRGDKRGGKRGGKRGEGRGPRREGDSGPRRDAEGRGPRPEGEGRGPRGPRRDAQAGSKPVVTVNPANLPKPRPKADAPVAEAPKTES